MDRSELLDELRLAVGSVGDYAKSLNDLYVGIVRELVSEQVTEFSVALYIATDKEFVQVTYAGVRPSLNDLPFGEGLHSIAAIRGEMVFEVCEKDQLIIAPFYRGHHLIGMLAFEIPFSTYSISYDDLVFVSEVISFLEAKYIELA